MELTEDIGPYSVRVPVDDTTGVVLGEKWIQIDNEKMQPTSIEGSAFHVSRYRGNTAPASHAAGATVTVIAAGDVAAVGGGDPWVLDLEELGDSLANFDVIAGTWAVVAGVIEGQGGHVQTRIRHDVPHPQSLVTYEYQYASGQAGGIALKAGDGMGDSAYLAAYLNVGDFTVDRRNVVNLITRDTNLAADTWHTIRAQTFGLTSQWWINDVLMGAADWAGAVYWDRWGLFGTGKFRNIRLYRPRWPGES